MRKFSQRNHLVTLSDINITPLLDLAFVLLIIFVITTPLLEQGLDLKLPNGGKPDRPVQKEDIRTLEIGRDGTLLLDRHRMTLAQVESELTRDKKANPKLAVRLRADRKDEYGNVVKVLNMLGELGIKISLRTEPANAR